MSLGLDLPAGPFASPFPLDGLALTEWERIIAEAFWLRETDASALADRCLCFQRLHEAEEDIRKLGMTTGRRGRRTANPSVRFARQYRQAIQRYDEQLGLTTSARERLGPGGPRTQAGDIDPLEAALCWPYGRKKIEIWQELRRGKVEIWTTAPEKAEWTADQLEADRRLAEWKTAAGIFDDGADGPIRAPGLNASAEEWQAYNTAKLEQHAKIETALRRAGLDPRKV